MDLCFSDVAGTWYCPSPGSRSPGTRTSAPWILLKQGRGGADLPLPLSSVLQGRKVSCSAFTNSRTELAAFDSALLGRSGSGGGPVVFTVSVPVFMEDLGADETAGQAPKFSGCPVQC